MNTGQVHAGNILVEASVCRCVQLMCTELFKVCIL